MNIKAITSFKENIINSEYNVEYIDNENKINQSNLNGKIIWDYYKNKNILDQLEYNDFKSLSKFNTDLGEEEILEIENLIINKLNLNQVNIKIEDNLLKMVALNHNEPKISYTIKPNRPASVKMNNHFFKLDIKKKKKKN